MEQRKFEFIGKHITLKETRTIALLVRGLARKQVADKLSVSKSAIDNQLTLLFQKLDVSSCSELVALAVINGFELAGCYKGEYLFDGIGGLPWE